MVRCRKIMGAVGILLVAAFGTIGLLAGAVLKGPPTAIPALPLQGQTEPGKRLLDRGGIGLLNEDQEGVLERLLGVLLPDDEDVATLGR